MTMWGNQHDETDDGHGFGLYSLRVDFGPGW